MSIDDPVRVRAAPAGGPAGSPARAEPATEPARPRAGPAALAEARQRLAEQQRELVDALTARTGAPDAFDPSRVHLARRMLARKRCHGLERAWPALIGALGERWLETYAEYATTHPIPAGGGPFEDGLAFARLLRRAGKLPAQILPALLTAEVRHGPPLRAGVASDPRRLVIAIRFGGRTRILVLPLDFSHTFRRPAR